jgi:pimeloyl-ACP methyl ester carboxylesterase/molybdopterin/thiamine biosynthesis adenylyltransferase
MTDETYEQSFSRNIGILTREEQETLSRSTVAIAGLGGIGGNTLVLLARMGVGKFRLADFDRFDLVNINRQYGARTDTRGQRKCEVLAEEVRRINPGAEIAVFEDGFTEDNADKLLAGAGLAVDAIDFYAIETHLAFHRQTRAYGLYTLMGSPVGFSACLQVFDPEGMSIEEYCGIREEMEVLEKQLRFACGLVPELLHIDYFDVSGGAANTDFLNRTGPSIASACSLAASLVATEAVLILLGRRKPRAIPHTFQFDPYTYRYARTHLERGMASYDPEAAIRKIRDKSSFVPQVLELFYRKKQAEKARVNGVELYYKEEGEGEPVLLISPLGADSSFWARQTPSLAEHFRVITFDNRGAGESSPCTGECSTETLADDAAGLLEHLGVRKARVVGLALGGLAAQCLAARRPDLVDRLVLASSYLKADHQIESLTAGWRRLAEEQGMEHLFEVCLEYLFSPAYIADNDGELDKLKTFYRLTLVEPRSFCQQSLAGVRHDSTDLVGRLACPTLVIHGGGDRLVDLRLGRALATGLPQGRLTVIEDAPHFLIWEHAGRFNSEVIRFLQG